MTVPEFESHRQNAEHATLRMSRCQCCGQLARVPAALIAGMVPGSARPTNRSQAASSNELATAIVAAEDVVDSHAAPLVVLGQGDAKVVIDLPKPDYASMQSFFRHLGGALGYPTAPSVPKQST